MQTDPNVRLGFRQQGGVAVITAITTLPHRVGAAWAQCATCRFVFTTVYNFDRHRQNGRCLHPKEAGLVLNKRGMWRKPWLPLFTGGVSVEGEIPAGTGQDMGRAESRLFHRTVKA